MKEEETYWLKGEICFVLAVTQCEKDKVDKGRNPRWLPGPGERDILRSKRITIGRWEASSPCNCKVEGLSGHVAPHM
eukprot:945473-Pelagomonas_calceolata.AAC.1